MRWLLRFTSLSAADVHIRVSLHKSDSHMSPVLTIKIKYVISSLKRQWLKKSSADINKLSSRQLTFAHSNTCYNKLYVTGLCENLRELVRLNCAFFLKKKKWITAIASVKGPSCSSRVIIYQSWSLLALSSSGFYCGCWEFANT